MESTSSYAKIQLFRIMHGHVKDSATITKYINESFHVENDFIMQLDPNKYDMVPSYIIDECDKLLLAPEA